MSENYSQQDKGHNYLLWIAGVVFFVGLLPFLYGLWRGYCGPDEWLHGTTGDFIGGIAGSLWALTGVVLFYAALRAQRQELRATHISIKQNREENELTRREFELQNQTLKLQRFENTFFNMLSIHHQIVNSIDRKGVTRADTFRKIDGNIDMLKGRDVFRDTAGIFKSYSNIVSKKDLNKKYLSFYTNVQTDFGHYFRNLYRMIKMVKESDIAPEDKKEDVSYVYWLKYKYITIIRAQLSDYELIWIFYNCLSELGNDKFKPLIEEYTLLKNIPQGEIANDLHKAWYKHTAFEKRTDV